ncbi:hypothetical protein QJ854_gp314 [Moumouvirus goulette]|uniref:Uncharacterized protein n=1 Tax=Moumouvirus goulette TaxID=1247379 RepID=M1PHC3_9VIRU|nr:hypothetical protein QJ854_gp314 [Moumouvirus goulette]AGF85468.1 hypothetical protein glt_00660 [Moumouvirus goulette]
MELTRMSNGIIKIISKKYSSYESNECLDIVQIKNICNLYKVKNQSNESVRLSEINLSSPEFKSFDPKINKNNLETLKSAEFSKKHSFFIRVIYACLKIGVELFNCGNEFVTLKNNYQLVKSLEIKKKQLINEHITILKNQYKMADQKIPLNYEGYLKQYTMNIRIIDKIMSSMNKLIESLVFKNTDTLLSLVLPYFFTYTEYIEEYN